MFSRWQFWFEGNYTGKNYYCNVVAHHIKDLLKNTETERVQSLAYSRYFELTVQFWRKHETRIIQYIVDPPHYKSSWRTSKSLHFSQEFLSFGNKILTHLPNSSSNAITISTTSRLSRPRSLMKWLSRVICWKWEYNGTQIVGKYCWDRWFAINP